MEIKLAWLGCLFVLLLSCFSPLIDAAQVDPQITAVQDLIGRWIPRYSNVFQLELISNADGDVFEVQSNGTQVVLRGTTGVNIASALHYYLKYFCNCHISWTGNQLNLPTTPPTVPALIRIPVPMTYRYYFNVCTFGYTTVWWDWDRWQREIDWMALNGVNLPLAFVGQEFIWKQVYEKLGLSTTEINNFFTGPAFLPWQRMGNVNGWGGGLSDYWLSGRAQLQYLILGAMRAFGMKPVLPAFAGHVPPTLKNYYPTANITQLSGWNTFNGTYLLDSHDPLFAQIGSMFISMQATTFGTDHYYNADLFNEEVPPSNDPTYLAATSKAVFSSMVAGDSKAIWVMQGWFFVSDPSFWQPAQAQAFLEAVPQSNLLMLDLWAELNPVWNRTEKFYGRDFVWCMLHNFGGRTGIYGAINSVASNPAIAYSQASNMVGMGLTPEAIETNIIMYDLMMEMPWRVATNPGGLLDDLDEWVQNFTIRRYGEVSQDAISAWHSLQNTILNTPEKTSGTIDAFLAFRPNTAVPLDCIPYYNSSVLVPILQSFINAAAASSTIANQETFQHDIASVTRQMIVNSFLVIFESMMNAYNSKDATAFNTASAALLQAILDTDTVVGTQEMWLVGVWIANAQDWGTPPEEKAQFEFNARNQLTLWGPSNSGLHDYAYKLWSGLVKDFYYPRWALFTSQLSAALPSHSFDYNAFVKTVQGLEYAWNTANNTYPTVPSGNAVSLASEMFAKYKVYLS